MHTASSPQEDSALGITPAIRPSMPWRVIEAQAQPNYRIRVRFVDGLTGEVDLSQLVKSEKAGVFSALADVALFQQLYIQWGAVTWPNELDLAPDAMHTEIQRNGVWIIH